MKTSQSFFFALLLLVMATGSVVAKTSRQDSLLLEHVFSFPRNYTHGVQGFATNIYVKYLYQTHRRNLGLWAIPTTYTIAKGRRTFVSEQYSRLYFRSVSDFDNRRQVYYSTIPDQRRTLGVLNELVTPNLYGVTIYGDHVLSPFCRENRKFYRYSTAYLGHGKVRLYFRPRIVPNTQLVKGKAIVDSNTGQIEQLEMEGEFDMIHFRTITMQGDYGARALLPKLCKTSIVFKFAGNHVTSDFTALYDCPITLPDTLSVTGDRQLIDSIRPISLSEPEQAVYTIFDSIYSIKPDTTVTDTVAKDTMMASLMKQSVDPYTTLDAESPEPEHETHDYWKEIGWDIIGSNLIHGLGAENKRGYFEFSPLINPQYISYSSDKGISYKLCLWGEYRINDKTKIRISPDVGYTFKKRELYFNIPVWLHYSPNHKGMWFLDVSQSNRIGNINVLEAVQEKLPNEKIEDIEERHLHYFGDNQLHVSHTMQVNKNLSVLAGLTYHYRRGVHARELRELGLPHKYESLAPSISIGWRPWSKAPMFTIEYERSITSRHLNIDYERWEADASSKLYLPHLQTLNLRLGAGVYTRRKGTAFMDFANFRDNNLPEGWDDDWSGDFQLLDSRLYNESRYYIRGNISYESPLLVAYLVPFLGRYVERERFYWSSLGIEHTRFYSELGYGFTTRLFSVGLFASFHNIEFQDVTAKFTFELFRRW